MKTIPFALFLLIITVPVFAAQQSETFQPKVAQRSAAELAKRDSMSVCPPFFLRDEQGAIIDPVHGINDQQPYSSKQTCGACHDYALITSAFHFQQGKDEALDPKLAKLYPWMSTPGQYGGRY